MISSQSEVIVRCLYCALFPRSKEADELYAVVSKCEQLFAVCTLDFPITARFVHSHLPDRRHVMKSLFILDHICSSNMRCRVRG